MRYRIVEYKCDYVNLCSSGMLRKHIFSSSSGAEPPLIGGFGLLNDILPLCSILDTV